MSPDPQRVSDILIVGGSLAGLMTGLALSRHGFSITLLERSTDTDRTGAALQVGYGLVEQLTGRRNAPGGLATGVQAWQSVYRGLRAAAEDAGILVLQNARVEAAGQGEGRVWATTSDNRRFEGAVLVGADGYQSVVRRHISPERPDAVFADYLAWVGFAEESALSVRFPPNLEFLESGPFVLLGFPLTSADGSPERGRRRVGWGWYDAGHNAILRETGAVDGNLVRHSLRPNDMPDELFRELAELARLHWPSPWCDAILECIARKAVLGTPVVEYLPDRLVSGRMCLVGDAAHVCTPMTGNGFATAADDALALARFLDAAALRADPINALKRYQASRLPQVRRLGQTGQRISQDFVRAAR
ncbi:MAG: FAD-dependent monooxygenase [Candidatus Andeanibacterium colombiense]|uniref:FAD-dependent monooxygenase n=1 Tax=Candidatus Andeanibacterium colombiense TaxID=3121345 RepID=A0AAJ5X673_9SPHN|nr:MAG: FAD-dependent monooxygenase [Sphingomonadaceae bacterium]